MRYFLLISHLDVQNANALSSPFTIGVPAMTACLGFMHALQRHLNQQGHDIILEKLAISYHDFALQTYRGKHDFHSSIIATANPLDKNGNRPAFIEEARCHLNASLLIELNHYREKEKTELLDKIQNLLAKMKFAGGDILSVKNCEILKFNEDKDEDEQLKPILNKLMLGSILIERRELLRQANENGQDSLTAMLDYLKVYHQASLDKDDKVHWQTARKHDENGQSLGWLVPIAVGFSGISTLGKVKLQRDNDTPHRFAESVLTLGEFIMPYRVQSLEQILWQYQFDEQNAFYVCQTDF